MMEIKLYSDAEVQEHLKAWVDALRSDQYKQTVWDRSQKASLYLDKAGINNIDLRTNADTWDAAGVACDKSGLGDWFINDKGFYQYQIKNCAPASAFWPAQVAAYYGQYPKMQWNDLMLDAGVLGMQTLGTLQINQLFTFKQIADLIVINYIHGEDQGNG